jgi:hypothetical protein
MAIGALYLAALLTLLGIMAESVLGVACPELGVVEAANSMMLYVLLSLFIMRFFVQGLTRLNPECYQTLPVNRTVLAAFIVVRQLVAPANYLSLFAIIPFAVRYIGVAAGSGTAWRFIINAILLIWLNSMSASWLKRKVDKSVAASVVIFLIAGILAAGEYYHLFSLRGVSLIIFDCILQHWFMTPLLLLLSAGMYFLNIRFLTANYYIDRFVQSRQDKTGMKQQFSLLERMGATGALMAMQFKLMLRNKRLRNNVLFSVILLAYGLFFYSRGTEAPAMKFFYSFFLSGFLVLNLSKVIIKWDSDHFEALMTRNFPTRAYLQAYYYLLLMACVANFILITPYFLYGREIMVFLFSSFMIHIGITVPSVLFMALFSSRALKLSRTSVMNQEPFTFKRFIINMVVMLGPMSLVVFIYKKFGLSAACAVSVATGMVGLALQKLFLKLCTRIFLARKYILLSAFRENE